MLNKLTIISCPNLNSTGSYLQVIRYPACQFKVWPHETVHISYCFCISYSQCINYQLDITISTSVIMRKIYFTIILCIYIIVLYFYCTKWLFTNLFLFHFQTKDCDMHAYVHLSLSTLVPNSRDWHEKNGSRIFHTSKHTLK